MRSAALSPYFATRRCLSSARRCCSSAKRRRAASASAATRFLRMTLPSIAALPITALMTNKIIHIGLLAPDAGSVDEPDLVLGEIEGCSGFKGVLLAESLGPLCAGA